MEVDLCTTNKKNSINGNQNFFRQLAYFLNLSQLFAHFPFGTLTYTFGTLFHTFSTFGTLSHTFLPLFSYFSNFDTLPQLLHTLSTFCTLSHAFTNSITFFSQLSINEPKLDWS